jgi:hypothetical protein
MRHILTHLVAEQGPFKSVSNFASGLLLLMGFCRSNRLCSMDHRSSNQFLLGRQNCAYKTNLFTTKTTLAFLPWDHPIYLSQSQQYKDLPSNKKYNEVLNHLATIIGNRAGGRYADFIAPPSTELDKPCCTRQSETSSSKAPKGIM